MDLKTTTALIFLLCSQNTGALPVRHNAVNYHQVASGNGKQGSFKKETAAAEARNEDPPCQIVPDTDDPVSTTPPPPVSISKPGQKPPPPPPPSVSVNKPGQKPPPPPPPPPPPSVPVSKPGQKPPPPPPPSVPVSKPGQKPPPPPPRSPPPTPPPPPPSHVLYQPIMPHYVLHSPVRGGSYVYGQGAGQLLPHSPVGASGFLPAPQWFLDLLRDKLLSVRPQNNPAGNQRGPLQARRFDSTSSDSSEEGSRSD